MSPVPQRRSCVHQGAKPETSPGTAPPTGIDYLALVGKTTTGYIDVKPRRPYDDPRAGLDSEAPNRQPAATYGPCYFGND